MSDVAAILIGMHKPTQTDSLKGRNASVALAVLSVGLVAGVYFGYPAISTAANGYLLDVGVFRDAGHAFREHQNLYVDFQTRSGFRFIYPPFAALLFVPLTWFGEITMQVVWTIATLAAVFAIIGMAVKRLNLRPWWMWSLGLTGLAVSLDPIRANLDFGQINVFLIMLIAMDALGFTPRRIRGIGIGIAAGIKITPAAYAAIFLARKDWIAVAQSAGFFLLTAVIGWIVRADSSRYFWTQEFFSSERGGSPPYPPNQALTGLIARAGVDSDVALSVMKPGFLIIAGLAIFVAWQLERAGRQVDAFFVLVLAVVLASPLSVSHHWSGMVVLVPLLFRSLNKALTGVQVLLALALFAGLYTVYPEDQPSYDFAFPQWFIGNSMSLAGLLLFVGYVVCAVKLARGNRLG